MSAPPILRLIGDRRVSVVRDAAAAWRVFNEDPVGSCMVAARVTDHGVDPNAIGGELWTRRGAEESLCFAGANLIPLRGAPANLNAFADEAMSGSRRCSSLVGRADLVLPMWQRLEHGLGSGARRARQPALMALSTTPSASSTPACARSSRTNWTPTWSPPSTCSSARWASTRVWVTAVAATAAGWPASSLRDGHGPASKRVRSSSRPRWDRSLRRSDRSRASGCIPSGVASGWALRGTATLAAVIVGTGRIASLYVNSFNAVARAAYDRIGFTEVGTFATVLLD